MPADQKDTQKITPCLWFDDQAEDAARFYTSLFGDSKMGRVSRYTEAGHDVHGGEAGSVLTAEFEVKGFQFIALNGGPHFTINPSISFFVSCETADEVDALWAALSDGGTALMPLDSYPFSPKYGWIQDRYGVSWQLMLAEGGVEHAIIPSLMFVGDVYGKAEEAIDFYTSVFDDAEPKALHRYGPGMEPDAEDAVMFADFTLEGQLFAAMDSAREHDFTFNEAASLTVLCDTQEEVDRYWNELSAVPGAEQCGWLKDRYGVSWQIVPSVLPELMTGPDGAGRDRVTEAMLRMKKLDISGLEAAYAGQAGVPSEASTTPGGAS